MNQKEYLFYKMWSTRGKADFDTHGIDIKQNGIQQIIGAFSWTNNSHMKNIPKTENEYNTNGLPFAESIQFVQMTALDFKAIFCSNILLL